MIQSVVAGSEKYERFPKGSLDDLLNEKFPSQLKKYYDKIITLLHEADSILIFGPGEAKVELGVRLGGISLADRIAGIETEEKMTDTQIVEKIREHFRSMVRKN
jgi:hypothetical protein